MATFCLTKQSVDQVKQALKDRSIDPFKMADMSSQERRQALSPYVGEENAVQVNALFESKLLLKNKKAGYISWAKKVTGISQDAKRDMLSRIERMQEILSPTEEQAFLEDLASKRLGVEVTQEEAKTISDLSKKVSELRNKTDTTKSDIALGRAILDLGDYVNSLKGIKADLLTNIAGTPRTLMSSADLSAPLNQGFSMIGRKRFYTSLGAMVKSAINKNAFRDLQAEIITHPKYVLAKKAGLRLTDLGDKLEMREEQFMSTLFDKVPGIAASQRAYTAFLNKLRIDSFNDFVNKAQIAGEDISPNSETVKDLAKVVNDSTGGARVGKVEGAVPLLNAAFFSARKITSTVNMMNPVNYINPNISKTARLERTRNLIGSLALSMGVIGFYSALTGEEQEKDPRSTDFGKIRSGDTRLDVTGGNGTYAILLARLITGKTKSSSGIVKELGSGFGETSGYDLIAQFLRYKLSPNASFLIDVISGENAIGEEKTVAESAIDRFKPMFANSLVELLKSDTEGKFGFALAGLFGGGLNTYSINTDWEESTSKELTQFRSKVGDDKFKEANEKFNTAYDKWLADIEKSDTYKSLSDAGKSDLLTKGQKEVKQQVFERYGFKYETKDKTPDEEKEDEKIDSLLNRLSSF